MCVSRVEPSPTFPEPQSAGLPGKRVFLSSHLLFLQDEDVCISLDGSNCRRRQQWWWWGCDWRQRVCHHDEQAETPLFFFFCPGCNRLTRGGAIEWHAEWQSLKTLWCGTHCLFLLFVWWYWQSSHSQNDFGLFLSKYPPPYISITATLTIQSTHPNNLLNGIMLYICLLRVTRWES